MRVTTFRRVLAGLGVAAVTFATAACGSGETVEVSAGDLGPSGDTSWQEVIDKAKEEGSVTYYSGQATDNLQTAATAFESAYGIKVDIVRDNDANLQTKLAAEETTGNQVADVVASDVPGRMRCWKKERMSESILWWWRSGESRASTPAQVEARRSRSSDFPVAESATPATTRAAPR